MRPSRRACAVKVGPLLALCVLKRVVVERNSLYTKARLPVMSVVVGGLFTPSRPSLVDASATGLVVASLPTAAVRATEQPEASPTVEDGSIVVHAVPRPSRVARPTSVNKVLPPELGAFVSLAALPRRVEIRALSEATT